MVRSMLPAIKGLIQNTLLDWEGKIAATVFLPNCNFRCPYCHAGYLVKAPKRLESIPFSAVADLAERHKEWMDGIVISGGEPTLHDGLVDLTIEIKDLGLGVKLDTNGSKPEVINALIKTDQLDCVAMDVKAPLTEKYYRVAGEEIDISALERSIAILMDWDGDYEFRMTVCPAFIEERDVIEAARAIGGAKRFILQQFKPDFCMSPQLRKVKPFNRDKLVRFAEQASKYVKECRVRGEPAEEFTAARLQ